MSDSVRPHRRQPTRLCCPWDSPGKNTGVGCHFLLQCMKVKSESEVAQSCPALSDPMDCSLPSSSVHGIFQARVLEWGATASPYLYHIYLLVQLEDILSFKFAKLYSHETPIYQLHCSVCVQLFVSSSYIFKQNIVFQSYLGQLNFPLLPSVTLCHTFVKPIQFLQNFIKFLHSALYCGPPNGLMSF